MMYNAISFLVSNRLFAILFTLSIALLAWVKLPDLKISQYPNIDIPMLTVNVYFPGASSIAIEKRVINKIEEKLENTRRLKKITSRITNSYAQIAIEFERGVDVDNQYTDVNSRLNNLKPDLPADVEIVVLKQSPVDRIVSFILGLSSPTANHAERVAAADELKRRLRSVNGLENLIIMKPDQEIQILLNLARMGRYGISVAQIGEAIKQSNQFLPTGRFIIEDKSISILSDSGGYNSVEEIANTAIISASGTAITLKNIATIQEKPRENTKFTLIDGVPAVWVTMKLNEDANVFRVKEELIKITGEFQAELGQDMTISWLFDVEEGVDAKLKQLLSNIFWGIVILAVVLLFAVGYRSAFIISMMLPVALLLSIVGLSLTDYGIQEISLGGFIVSLGLIVDSGIVVTENAFKLKTYSGYDRKEAAITGTATVMTPLVSSTLTTALAFAPIFLLSSITGLFLHSFVVTIWLCLAASLIAAVAFAALLLARIGTDNKVPGLPTIPSFMNGLRPFRDKVYVAALKFLIKHPVVLAGCVAVALSASFWAAAQLDVIVFPDSEEPYFTVTIEADEDRSTAFMLDLSAEISDMVSSEEEVLTCSGIVGATFPGVHTGIRWLPDARNVGTVFCQVNFRDSKAMNVLVDRVNSRLEKFVTDANVEAAAFINGDGVDLSDIEIKLSGQNIATIREEARKLEDHLRGAGLEMISYYNNPAQSNWFAVDIRYRDKAANALGVSRSAVDQALVLLTYGYEVDEFRRQQGDEIPIMLKVETELEDPFRVFDRVFVTSRAGNQIPLSQLVEITYKEDEYAINHEQFKPELKIGMNVAAGRSIIDATMAVKDAVEAFEISDQVTIEYGGQLAASEDAFGGAGRYVGIIGLLILGIFVLQFNSVLQPLIIFAAIPLSFIGGFLLLWISGQPLSFLAFVGLTSLMGIVINNSILLVDEGNRLFIESPDKSPAEVAISAGVNRFMPIVLTSLTSICGLLPLALGDSMFKALAIVVIGGLSTSTVLTLVCVPVLYALVPSRRRMKEPEA